MSQISTVCGVAAEALEAQAAFGSVAEYDAALVNEMIRLYPDLAGALSEGSVRKVTLNSFGATERLKIVRNVAAKQREVAQAAKELPPAVALTARLAKEAAVLSAHECVPVWYVYPDGKEPQDGRRFKSCCLQGARWGMDKQIAFLTYWHTGDRQVEVEAKNVRIGAQTAARLEAIASYHDAQDAEKAIREAEKAERDAERRRLGAMCFRRTQIGVGANTRNTRTGEWAKGQRSAR